MLTHAKEVWLPSTLDVIESDKHILDISQSLHTQLAILIGCISTENKTKAMQPALKDMAILTDPAYMRELEKKYFDPLEKTIQVGFTECDDQDKKGLIPPEAVAAKRRELHDLQEQLSYARKATKN